MKQWTQAAEVRWLEYLRERVAREGLNGEEADELRHDLRRHIHEELSHLNSAICGLHELEQAIARMDAGYRIPAAPLPPTLPMRKRVGGSFFWFFAVILPLLVVLFEWVANFCATHFFDPIPTFGHGLLLVSVPLLNGWLIRSREQASPSTWRKRAVATGLTFGTGLFYALLFLPLAPISVMALLAFGMGLLSLCPIITWLLSWRLTVTEHRLAKELGCRKFHRTWLITAVLAFAALLSYEAPALRTRYLVRKQLTEKNEEAVHQALVDLRSLHSQDTLLRMCYENTMALEGSDISSWIMRQKLWSFSWGSRWATADEISKKRDLYFRVTGEPFNAKPRPGSQENNPFSISRRSLMIDEEMDVDHGGDQVASKTRFLDCKESRFDAHLDGQARIGYGEWTLVFQNRSETAREARCQIRMPRHGHVSRLTLWINGEPNEAAFGSVAQVKAAYKEVAVVQRRDPVLVNMVGPDTIMVQCFPVPANGEMKIRIGITAPFDGNGWSLPHIIEKNFGEVASFEHALWLQADKPFLLSGAEQQSHPDERMHSLHFGSKKMNSRVEIPHLTALTASVWCEDPFAHAAEKILIGKPIESTLSAVKSLIVVVDGSQALKKHRATLASQLRGRATSIFLAKDESVSVTADELATAEFEGGCDNEHALYQALLKAKESPDSAVVWLHGPQPVTIGRSERIQQMFERGGNRPRFYAVPLVEGSNRLFESLGRSGFMTAAPELSLDADGLARWLDRLQAGEPATSWEWSRRADATGLDGAKVSDQLARLWAMEKVAETKDSALAVRYQLVSYVSGAVVLETKEQYERHGLKQVDATSTPTITNVPEPSTALLVLMGSLMACLHRRR